MLAGFFFDNCGFLCDKNAKPSCKVLDFVACLAYVTQQPCHTVIYRCLLVPNLLLEASCSFVKLMSRCSRRSWRAQLEFNLSTCIFLERLIDSFFAIEVSYLCPERTGAIKRTQTCRRGKVVGEAAGGGASFGRRRTIRSTWRRR